MEKQIIAAFDFDGTLTQGFSSRLLFLKHLVGMPKMLQGIVYSVLQAQVKQNSVTWHKELDRFVLNEKDMDFLNEEALIFFNQVLIKKLRTEALHRLDFHQRQGHTCILVSGAWDIYLKHFANQFQFDQLICTELEFNPQNKCTGRMKKEYCLGKYKLEEFKERYSTRDNYILYAYGDSPSDLALLNYADYAFYKCFQ
ncbi:HAD-IB family hydrolase [Legionella sp. WA2022007384]